MRAHDLIERAINLFLSVAERQVFASWSVKYTFELGKNCVTADYAITDDPRKISVFNECKSPTLLSALGRVEGIAIQSPICPGAFSVPFGRNNEAPVRFDSPGNYWIIKLGLIIEGA